MNILVTSVADLFRPKNRASFPWETLSALMLSLILCLGLESQADVQTHEQLHFSHPMVSESPSPDTKIRLSLDHDNGTREEKADRDTVQLEAEYAFARWISVEAAIPYTFLDPEDESSRHDFDNIEVALKLASFHFEEKGLLLGGGLEVGLPTGNGSKEIGSNHIVEVEPFISFGHKRGSLETVGVLALGFPRNRNGKDEADVEIGWNLSFLYHIAPDFQALLEFDGEEIDGGEEDGTTIVNISPGFKMKPFANKNLEVGTSLSFPLSNDKEFHTRGLVSVFYHF